MKKNRFFFKTVVLILIAIGIVKVALLVGIQEYQNPQFLIEKFTALSNHSLAPLFFGISFVVLPMFGFPTTALIAVSAALYGVLKGSLIVYFSSLCGAALAYTVSRYVLSDFFESRLYKSKIYQKLDLNQNGFKLVLTFRLFSVNYTFVNYLSGILKINGSEFLWASAIGQIPGIFISHYFFSTLMEGYQIGFESKMIHLALSLSLLVLVFLVPKLKKFFS